MFAKRRSAKQEIEDLRKRIEELERCPNVVIVPVEKAREAPPPVMTTPWIYKPGGAVFCECGCGSPMPVRGVYYGKITLYG